MENGVIEPRRKRSLEELNMMDSFLFSVCTEKKEHAECIARLIIERATGKRVGEITVESEKQILGIDTRQKGIRMDLYVTERDDERIVNVYDIEPNNYTASNLEDRSRFYQSLSDSKMLSGKRYEDMPDYMSIWILPWDPFGENRMVYTVKNQVVESPGVVYNDGVTKMFIYVNGETGGSEELRTLLTYMKDTRECNAVDEELKTVQHIVDELKHDREVGEHYMTWDEIVEWEREKGKAEGAIEATKEAVLSILALRGDVSDELTETIKNEYDLQKLKSWSVLAATVSDVEEFKSRM